MGKSIVILGAGFGGLAAANMLRKELNLAHRIIVIDKKKSFMMGLVNLWILYGSRQLEKSQTPLDGLNAKGIEYLNDEITKIDTAGKNVITSQHGSIRYDYLLIALGAELAPEKIAGFVGTGYNLYDPAQVPKLREKLLSLKKGRVAITIMGMPYKCPPAPYETSLLINDMLTENGTRNSVSIDVYSPAPIALPVAGQEISQEVVDMIQQKGINFHPVHKLKSVGDKEIEFENGNRESYDVLIGIPPHRVPDVIKNSDLIAPGQDWMAVDKYTLRTPFENVFAVGDVTEIKLGTLAVPKAGIFAEAEAKVVAHQIADEINQKENNAKFDGKGYCFMETGDKKAGYVEADFYSQTGPVARLEAPSERSYEKKQDFERTRVKEWLL